MMNRHTHFRQMPAIVLLAAAAAVLGGCASQSMVELVSYQDPYFPDRYELRFDECTHRFESSGDVHVVGLATNDDGESPMSQYLHVHMYWEPRPGKTPAESSTSNATLCYIVATEDGVATYEGTGFAFPKRKRNGTLVVNIESARLHLKWQRGDVPDVLGDTRVSGKLVSQQNPGTTSHRIREMDLLPLQ